MVDLAEHEKPAKKAEAKGAKIKIPTKIDYKHVPKQYVTGRHILPFEKLRNVLAGTKRLHDWYMWASSVGIDAISVHIGGLLCRRRSHKKKHLRKIDTKPKISIRELWSIFPDAPT
jgi:hypothetical protein